MADIRQRIIASDETAAAYNSAKKRVQEYSGAVKAGSNENAIMTSKAANAAESVGALGSALDGSGSAMSRVTNAAGKLIPGIAGFAAPIAIGIAAITALKMAWTEFGLTTRLKAWFTGQPLNDVMSFSESVKKAADDYKASMERMRASRDATFGQQKAEVEQKNADSPMAKKAKLARIAYEQEMEAVARSAEDAAQAVKEAEDNLAVVNRGSGMVANEEELKAIREAESDLARKRADYAAEDERQKTLQTTAALKYKQAMQDVAKSVQEANDSLAAADLSAKIQQAGDDAKVAAEYIKMADDALAAVGKSKRLGDVLAGGLGDRGAAAQLKERQAQVAMIDEQSRLIKARTDPGAKAQLKAEEKERRRTEGMIKSAEDWKNLGRPLSKWQQQILDEQAVLKFQAQEQARADAAKLAADQLKEQQAQDAREKQVKSLLAIERDLRRTLQAGA